MTEKLDIDDTPDTLLDSKRRVDVLSRLLEVSKKINSTLDMEVVVSNIIAASKEVMQADTASLLLMDKAREHLVFEVALGKSGEALKKGQMRVKVGSRNPARPSSWMMPTRTPAFHPCTTTGPDTAPARYSACHCKSAER